MPVYLDAVGNARALNTVTVRPQVDGKLIKVAFREGQDVKTRRRARRDRSAHLSGPKLDQAVAKKAQDEATLANARIDLDRYTRLVAANSGSKQQADTQKALVAQLEALVRLDQAAIDNAKTHARLHQGHRADLRPHRPASGGRRQYRARRPTPPAS